MSSASIFAVEVKKSPNREPHRLTLFSGSFIFSSMPSHTIFPSDVSTLASYEHRFFVSACNFYLARYGVHGVGAQHIVRRVQRRRSRHERFHPIRHRPHGPAPRLFFTSSNACEMDDFNRVRSNSASPSSPAPPSAFRPAFHSVLQVHEPLHQRVRPRHQRRSLFLTLRLHARFSTRRHSLGLRARGSQTALATAACLATPWSPSQRVAHVRAVSTPDHSYTREIHRRVKRSSVQRRGTSSRATSVTGPRQPLVLNTPEAFTAGTGAALAVRPTTSERART